MWWGRQRSAWWVCKPRTAKDIRHHQKLGKGTEGPSPRDVETVWPCQYLDFQLPASRAARESTSVGLSHSVCRDFFTAAQINIQWVHTWFCYVVWDKIKKIFFSPILNSLVQLKPVPNGMWKSTWVHFFSTFHTDSEPFHTDGLKSPTMAVLTPLKLANSTSQGVPFHPQSWF